MTVGVMISIFVIAMVIPVLIGVYVYRDASDRGMNAVLWTLVAVLAPSLIGFIIYLLVRSNYSNLKCRVCGTRVRENYVVCPGCGTKLKPCCPNCSAPVEPGWKVCPRCAAPLPEHQDNISAPIKKKDRTLVWILTAVILIPIVMILLALITFSIGSTMTSSVGMFPVDDYVQETGNTQIEDWIQEKSVDLNKAIVLRYEDETEDETYTEYLIYMPALSEEAEYSVNSGDGFFRDTIELDIERKNEGSGNALMFISCTSDRTVDLEIMCEGEKVQYEIEEALIRELRECLDRYSEETGREFCYFEYHDGTELLKNYQPDFDLIFMDIKMEKMNGLKTAEEIRKVDGTVGLMFLTSISQYVWKGYEYGAVNYLLKPLKYGRLKMELDRYFSHYQGREEPFLSFANDSGKYKVLYKNIRYAETYKRNVLLHFENQIQVIHKNMKEVAALLETQRQFCRCHASFAVNLSYVKGVEGLEVLLTTGERVPVSQPKRKAFMAKMADFWGDML